MEDKLKRLIESVTRAAAARHPGFDGVYREEPILYTADRMKSYTPPRIGEMRRIAAQADWRVSEGELFCRQGEFMAEYEEDYPFSGTFTRYYPTYQAMNNAQLRGYFAWRTRRRRGEAETPPLSFAFVYAYELIHGIGVESPLQGYEALAALRRDYGEAEPTLDAYLEEWMEDFVLYYRLDPALLGQTRGALWDGALAAAEEKGEPGDRFAALCALSTYRAEEGWAGREHPRELAEVTCRGLEALAEYYAAHRGQSLWDRLLGRPAVSHWIPFRSAVFFDRQRWEGEYVISSNRRLVCREGQRLICSARSLQRPSPELGRLLKGIDGRLREVMEWGRPLRYDLPKYALALLDRTVADWRRQQAEAEARRVDIDFGKLAAIRQAAEITRDRLLADPPEEVPPSPPPAPTPAPEPAGLTPGGVTLLHSLLYEAAPRVPAGEMLSVTAEGVNEALFDTFGDTVILFEGDTPALVEDYIEELKGMIRP